MLVCHVNGCTDYRELLLKRVKELDNENKSLKAQISLLTNKPKYAYFWPFW